MSKPSAVRNTTNFDRAFEKRLGQDPVSYVSNKLASGSDLGAIRQLFDILAAEVELRDRCNCPGFDFYYEKALSKQIIKEEVKVPERIVVTKEFAMSQLIGKERFVTQYGELLKRLAENHEFMTFVEQLHLKLAGMEFADTRMANKCIADYFYANKANEKYPEVKVIVETVVLLSKGEVDSKKIRVEFSLEDMDMSEFQDGATYPQIKAYVLEHSGLKVSNLYISQIKRKCGIEVGKNYNLPKSEDSRQPMCPPEKEKAIREAFKYFGMI